MIVSEKIDGLEMFRIYAAKDNYEQLYYGDPPRHDGSIMTGNLYSANDNLSILLCKPLAKDTYRRIKSINFDTGVVEFEISESEQRTILEKSVKEWCSSMRGRLSPTKAEQDLWDICVRLGLAKEETSNVQ